MAENGACEGKKKLASRAKELNLDAIHDTVHEMAKDEARLGCAFAGLVKRYFGLANTRVFNLDFLLLYLYKPAPDFIQALVLICQ